MIALEKGRSSKLIPAPIDNKNIMQDWIEEVFDEQSALISKRSLLGFIKGVAFECRIEGNQLRWLMVHAGYYENEDDRRAALAELKKRLQEIDADNENNGIHVDYYDVALIGLIQSFYFVDEE